MMKFEVSIMLMHQLYVARVFCENKQHAFAELFEVWHAHNDPICLHYVA